MPYETQNISTTEPVSQPGKGTEARRVRILETIARMQRQLHEINKALHRRDTFKKDQATV
jgi:hypothetical protein